MSVFSVTPSAKCPVTTASVEQALSDIGVTLPESEVDDYRRLLGVYHDVCESILAEPDYTPPTDTVRFPRRDIHVPSRADNKHNAWACRCSIQRTNHVPGESDALEGKTIGIKDNIAVAGVPLTFGTDVFTDYTPTVDATVVSRILKAGGHIVGKTTCENLCTTGLSNSAATGPVDNPFAPGYSAGGSSGGSAVAVALGEVDMAIGGDQGGSVRVPASNCGIVGLKPTFGLVPYTGAGSGEAAIDHLGPMTRTVEDNARLLDVIVGADGWDDRCHPGINEGSTRYCDTLVALKEPGYLWGKRIGVIKQAVESAVLHAGVKKCFLETLDRYKRMGAEIVEVDIPLHSLGPALWAGQTRVGMAQTIQPGACGRRVYNMNDLTEKMLPWTQEKFDKIYVSSKNIHLSAAYAGRHFPTIYGKSMNLAKKLRDAYDMALSTCDALATPTLPYIATSHATKEMTPIQHIEKQLGLTSNTGPFNLTGHPALTHPVGTVEIEEGPLKGSGTRLPVGFQLIGKWWDESNLFRLAYGFETNFPDWKILEF